MKRIYTLAGWLLVASHSALAQQSSEPTMEGRALYAGAVKAINEKDCAKGAVLLRKFKQSDDAYLSANPEILAKVDAQIAACEKTVIDGATTGLGGKPLTSAPATGPFIGAGKENDTGLLNAAGKQKGLDGLKGATPAGGFTGTAAPKSKAP